MEDVGPNGEGARLIGDKGGGRRSQGGVGARGAPEHDR